MPRCPCCDSPRIVIVLSPNPRAFCGVCGATWIQEGALQRNVRAAGAPRPARRPA